MQLSITKDKKEKKNILQRELSTKEVLAGLGIFTAVMAYGFVAVYPRYTEYEAAKTNLVSLQNDIKTYEAKLAKMPELEEKLDNLKREVKVKSRMLAHNMEDGMFLIGLSNLMSSRSVDMVDYTVDEVIPYDTFYAIPTSISVRGDYRHVREIMLYLEQQKNMTQILDYSMETHIPEANEQSNQNQNAQQPVTIQPNNVVFWTGSGAAYHNDGCSVLEAEKAAGGNTLLSGSPSTSGKNAACQVCKPYTTVQANTQPQEQSKPKPNGEIEATFKFIMYSSENPVIDLQNEDSSKWNPGKYNPFKSTI